MKKSIKIIIAILVFGFLYIELTHHFGHAMPCLIKKLTGYFCPGCGVTRMFYYIFEFDLYKAFRSNMLIFSLLPFMIILLINYIYSLIKGIKPIVLDLHKCTWYILIFITILFGILRNYISFLAPL